MSAQKLQMVKIVSEISQCQKVDWQMANFMEKHDIRITEQKYDTEFKSSRWFI